METCDIHFNSPHFPTLAGRRAYFVQIVINETDGIKTHGLNTKHKKPRNSDHFNFVLVLYSVPHCRRIIFISALQILLFN